jgi:hypothetical protein
MDDRLEIWIARDPETDAESRAVSLRKLRKGVRIGRLKPETLVKRVDASEWVTLERLLTDADSLSKTPPPVQAREVSAHAPPKALPKAEELSSIVVSESVNPPPVAPNADTTGEITEVEEIAPAPVIPSAPPTPTITTLPDEESALTTQWFTQSVIPPEPDDDVPIFPTQSLLDLSFENVLTTRFVRLTWALLLASLSLAIIATVIRAIAIIVVGSSAQVASALAIIPIVILGAAVIGAFGRMVLEVLLAVIRIADRLTALSKSVAP